MESAEKLTRPQAYLLLANTVYNYSRGDYFYDRTRRKIHVRDGVPFWDTQDEGRISETQKNIVDNPMLSQKLIEKVNELLEFDQPEKENWRSRRNPLQFRIRERLVAILRYGLGNGQPLDLTEIGRELRMSPSQVRTLELSMIRKLSRHYNLEVLQEFLPQQMKQLKLEL